MKRMWTNVRKEIIHIIRDPQTLALVIIMPVMMLVLMGYAVSADIEDIPTAIVDYSKTDVSRRFIDRYWASGYFEITHYLQSEDEILELIDAGYVDVGMLIPEDFGREVSSMGSSPVQFFVDGSDPSVAETEEAGRGIVDIPFSSFVAEFFP